MDLLIGKKLQLHSTNISQVQLIWKLLSPLCVILSQIQGDIGKILSHEYQEWNSININRVYIQEQ